MVEKKCKDCHVIKKKSLFYGIQGECKECTKKRVKERYYSPETHKKIVDYDKKRAKLPDRQAQIAAYKKKRRQSRPGQYRAYTILNGAISSGKIKRGSCSVCGQPDAQGHHNDYRRPLVVVWLCQKHHLDVHRDK